MTSHLLSFPAIVVAALSLVVSACGGDCEPTEVPVSVARQAQTLVVTFDEAVFSGDAETRDDGLLVSLRADESDLGRWQASAASPARGIVSEARVIDDRTVEIDLNGEVAADTELRIRVDTEGECDGPVGTTTINP